MTQHTQRIVNTGTVSYTSEDLFSGLSVTSGTDNGKGGALYNNGGDVTIDGSTFTLNTGALGGAVATVGGNLTIQGGALFAGNTADVHGGAIYLDGTASINGATFSGNISTETSNYGGAIYRGGGSPATIENSLFENNAGGLGGAVGAQDVVTITGSTFTGNTATSTVGGGALYQLKSGRFTVSDSTFTNNVCVNNSAGGAVYANQSDSSKTFSMDNCVIDGSTAKFGAAFRNNAFISISNTTITNGVGQYGGVVYTWSNSSATDRLTVFTNVTATGNSATDNGGVLYKQDYGVAKLIGGTYADNYTNKNGGVIYVEYGAATVTDGLYTGNRAKNHGGMAHTYRTGTLEINGATVTGNTSGSDGRGGAIYNNGFLTVSDTLFTLNNGLVAGGIYNNSNTTTISGSTFSHNISRDDGGAVYNAASATMLIDTSVFDSNTIGYAGGLTNYGTMSIDQSVISNHSSPKNAGGITLAGTGVLTLTDSTVSGNFAKQNGGGMFANGSDAAITNALFANNSASTHGAAIYVNKGTITVEGSTFTGNSASNSGGIYNNSNLIVEDSDFTGNYAMLAPGIYNQAGTATVSGSTFANNVSGDDASVLYNNSGAVVVLDAVVLDANTTGWGGAVQNKGQMTVENSIFRNNVAPRRSGGAFVNNASGTATVENSTFTNNSANYSEQSGGAMFNYGASNKITVIDSLFNGNSSKKGGAIAQTNGTLELTGSTLTGNSGQKGGALYVESGVTATITSTEFSENTGSDGGVIYNAGVIVAEDTLFTNNGGVVGSIYNTGTFTASDVTLTGNTTSDDGLIYNLGKVYLTDVVVENNRTGYNGVLHNGRGNSTGCIMTIDGSTISNNDAARNGGGVMNYAGNTVTISASTFTGNRTGDVAGIYSLQPVHGGAINNRGDATVTDTVFSANSAGWGGAIRNEGTITVENALFQGNYAKNCAGAFSNLGGTATLISCTFDGNSALENGGAIRSEDDDYGNSGNLTLRDCSFLTDSDGVRVRCGTLTLEGDITMYGYLWSDTAIVATNLDNFNFGYTTLNAFTAGGAASLNFVNDDALTVNGQMQGFATYSFQGADVVNFAKKEYDFTSAIVSIDNVNELTAEADGALVVAEGNLLVDSAAEYQVAGQTATICGVVGNYTLEYDDRDADGVLELYLDSLTGRTTAVVDKVAPTAPAGTVCLDDALSAGNDKIFVDDSLAGQTLTLETTYLFHEAQIYGATNTTVNAAQLDAGANALTIRNAAWNGKLLGQSVALSNVTLSGNLAAAESRCDIVESIGDVNLTLTRTSVGSSIYGSGIVADDAFLTTGAVTVTLTESTGPATRVYAGGQLDGNGTIWNDEKVTLNIHGGTWGQVFAGARVENNTEASYTGGSAGVEINITDGKFSNWVTTGSQLRSGNAEQFNSTINITGGTFNNVCTGAYSMGGDAIVRGDTTLNISGGTFNGYIFGGSGANSNVNSTKTRILGGAFISIDATSNAISFAKNIYLGSYGMGTVESNSTVTIKGYGENLTFSEGVMLSAASQMATRSNKYVGSVRTLAFQQFSGELNCTVSDNFTAVTVESSAVAFTKGSLSNVSSWAVEVGSENAEVSFGAEMGNNFANDSLVLTYQDNVEMSSGDTWAVFSAADANALAGWESFASVSLFTEAAAYSDGVWTSDNYRLALNGTALAVTRV